MLQADVYEGIESVDRAVWDALTEGHPYASWEWCVFGEAMLEDDPRYYVIVREGSTPVAAAQFGVRRHEYIPSESRIVLRMLDAYFERRPLLICRTALGTYARGFYLPDDPALADLALNTIRDAGHELARQHNASFTLYDYIPPTDLSHDWGGMTRMQDYMKGGTRLDVQWDTYEEWTAHLSRRNRKTVRHNTRHATERGITVEFHDHVTRIDEAIPLIHGVQDNYGYSYQTYTRRILEGASLLPETIWMTATVDDRLVGCEMLFYDRATGTCSATLYGRDYDVDFVYFLMYYAEIRHVIETLHANTLLGDTDAYQVKYRLGFTPDDKNNLVFTPTSRFGQMLTRLLIDSVN